VEIGTEAAPFLFWEYINGISYAVQAIFAMKKISLQEEKRLRRLFLLFFHAQISREDMVYCERKRGLSLSLASSWTNTMTTYLANL
jgi:hypothetical protein